MRTRLRVPVAHLLAMANCPSGWWLQAARGSARVLLGVGSETLPGGGRLAPYVSGLNVPSWAGASGGEGGGGDTRADGAALDAEDRACQGCRGNGRGP
jgi:hypothetical protein